MTESKRTTEQKKSTTISIPTPLFEKIKERIKDTGFATVSNYVTYVLREILVEKEEEAPFTQEDKERIKARLKALGYID
jgi:Arc/MetJ-type ribon-helix-helix transcriptional regulator